MIVNPTDRPAVEWAMEQGYMFSYVREYGLPEPSLQIGLGLSTAFFNSGRLVAWRATASGDHFDDLMRELASLLGFCSLSRAYVPQHLCNMPQWGTSLSKSKPARG